MASRPIRPVYNVLQWQRNKDVLEIPRCGRIPGPYLDITCSAASSVLLRLSSGEPPENRRGKCGIGTQQIPAGDENERTGCGKRAYLLTRPYLAVPLAISKINHDAYNHPDGQPFPAFNGK